MTTSMRTLLISCIVFSSIILYNGALAKKKVCVIGAGRSGLAAVKLVADQIDNFKLYLSPLSEIRRTNLRKSLMVYPDYTDFRGEEDTVKVSHKMVLEYLKNYTDYFHLRKFIMFDTIVTKVYPIKAYGNCKTTTWQLEMRNLITNNKDTTICDAIIVCNGEYSKPNIPKIAGMETFPGRVLHSRSYRQPEDFSNRTIVVLGAGDSGTDIASHLGAHAKKVYLSQRYDWDPFRGERPPKNVEIVPGVLAANGSQLILQDNSTIVVDTFIFCTGYLYDFPFLDERSGIVVEKKQIRPLFHQSINVEHPSMIIIGLPKYHSYGKVYYMQIEYFLKVLLGERKLPSYDEMLEDSKNPVTSFRRFPKRLSINPEMLSQ